YLGRYISRPPLAMSRLKHYGGHSVVFSYLDHNTKTYREFRCEGEAFIELLTQHIPEKHFRMIRYYGFLAHCVRSTLLPKVNELLNHSKGIIQKIRFPELLKQSFGLNPLQCILCGSQLHFSDITPGLPLRRIQRYHKKLALGKKVP
nr:transposase [Bacteroidota bacterium]